jgi:glycosidase
MRCSLVPVAALLILVARPMPGQVPERDTSWVARSALYEVFVQDFSPSGDFRGVIAGLDRIQAAGANTVWVMPVQPIGVVNRKGSLGSPYAALDYRAINPALGTAEDFEALVQAVHARGMKIILDWVPDHTSPDNPWVREHPDFYVHNERGEPSVPRDADGKLTDWTDVVQLDYKNPELRRAMIEVMRYWLEEYGLDGFRVDVAGFIPTDFWRQAIPALRGAVPRRILLLAEWGDPEWIRAGFDLIYSWDSYRRLKSVWRGAPASTFIDSELVEMRAMPPGGMKMRFTTNHDETAWDNPPVAIFGRGAGARAAFVAAALLPGRPLLYNGQEVESQQKLPLFEKEAVAWDQPKAEEARTFYHRVLELARTEPALIAGDFAVIATSAPADVIAYRRGGLVVLVNPRPREVRVRVTGIELNGAHDLLSTTVLHGNRVTLPAYGAMVLRWAGH